MVEIFVVAALSLKPGESYIMTMVRAFQWVIVLMMVFFMYRGTKVWDRWATALDTNGVAA